MADRLVIIGGGAAGLVAAISAAECGDRVTIVERMDRVGRKLLATGNGRCNLMNTSTVRYASGDAFAQRVLQRCGADAQRTWWEGHGLRLREEEGGRVYPCSGAASTVLDVLRLQLERLHIAVKTDCTVLSIDRRDGGFRVKLSDGAALSCERVIVAAGGQAQPKLGSDGSGYALLERLGHRISPLHPALTQVETDIEPIRGLSGIRIRCEVAAVGQGLSPAWEKGELLFTDYGISGVCVMNIARDLKRGDAVCVNLLPALGFDNRVDFEQTLHERRRVWGELPMEQLLTGLCVPRLSLSIGKAAGVPYRDRRIESLTNAELTRLCDIVAAWYLPVRGLRGYAFAQVTAGGADTRQFSPDTLESTLCAGLHAAGEVLDVDGCCGGLNLMFAFGSGILAGQNDRH